MKFGLVGTGHWARVTHGAALASEPEVALEVVWGRDPQRTAALAAHLGVRAASSYAELLDRVEAVTFCVPPEVQVALAVEAAGAGRHLLLEKPIATTVGDADRLADAVAKAGVSSVVFFTARFDHARRDWLAGLADGGWQGGWARWLAANFSAGSPYASSEWRWTSGGLWDLGPHLLALLIPVLGPVVKVRAEGGEGDLVHLIFAHDSGATSTASVTLRAAIEAASNEVGFWGPKGLSLMPPPGGTSVEALRRAARELIATAEAGRVDHPCDVNFGRYVVRVLADAESNLTSGHDL